MEQQVNEAVNVDMDGGKTVDMKVEPQFSGKPGDFAKDMELLRQQVAQPVAEVVPEATAQEAETSEPVVEPSQPEKLSQADATPPVPAKFQDKDGNLDVEKVEKATLNAEQTLARYLELERNLKRTMTNVSKAKEAGPYQPPTAAEPESFEAQLEADIQKYGAGKTLSKLFHAAQDAAYAKARADIEGVLIESEIAKRERELRDIGKNDPWVLSEQGMNTLAKYRETRPWLNDSPAPWTEAYKAYLGDQQYAQRTSRQVTTPTPKNAKVPPAPIAAAGRPSTTGTNDPAKFVEMLSKLSPEQEDAYWAKMGFPPIHKRR